MLQQTAKAVAQNKDMSIKPRRALAVRALLLILLTLLAIAGNVVNVPLFFGVDILFGSIAALLALAWLGPWAGIGVAVVGSSYTWLLWGHPYAIVIFTAEIAVVGWLRQRALRRDRPAPPLAAGDALYWMLVGIPLVLLCYHLVLGLDWTTTWLIAVKQALNGIFNAGLAGLLVLATAALRHKRSAFTFERILFNVLLTASLLPALALAAWQNHNLKHQLETEYAQVARLNGAIVASRLAQRIDLETADRAGVETALNRLSRESSQLLGREWDSGLALRLGPSSQADGDGAWDETGVHGLWLRTPDSQALPRLDAWRQAEYQVRLPPELSPIDGRLLLVGFKAAPLIDELQGSSLVLLSGLLALALVGIAIGARLSSWLTQPLHQLVRATRELPSAIHGSQPLPTPAGTPIRETDELATTVHRMAQSLRTSFEQLEQERLRQSQQQAIAALQARMLSQLIAHQDDEPAFGQHLCSELEQLLPGYHCALLRQAPNKALEPLARGAARTDADVAELLSAPTVASACAEAIRSATPVPVLLAAEDEAGPRSALALPVAGQSAALIAIGQQAAESGSGSSAFVHELLAVAASLASVAFEALQLRYRHQVLIEALSQAQTGVLITERVGGEDLISYVNSGFELMTGYSADEVLGSNCRFLQGEDRAQQARAQMRDALGDGNACRVIIRNYRKDGSRFWNSLHISPMRHSEGHVTHYIGIQQDVTDAIETLERLRFSEAQLKEAQAIAHVGSWDIDRHDGRIHWSDETFRLLGFAPGALEPSLEAFLDVVDPADRRRVEDAIATAKQDPTAAVEIEHGVHGADGVHRTLLQQWRAQVDPDRDGERIVGTCLDLTELRRAEALLRQQEERYRLMVENVEDLIVRIDRDGQLQLVSPSYCAVFGRDEHELLGTPFIVMVHADDRDATETAMAAVLDPPYAGTLEQRAQTRDGWRWLQWSYTGIRDAGGDVVGIIGVGRDITERRQTEVALAEREAMVSELLALATRFVSVSDDTLDAAIDHGLARIGAFIGGDRAYLFRVDADGDSVTNTHEWTAAGIAPMRGLNQGLPTARIAMMMERLARGEPVSIEHIAALTDNDWADERRLLEAQQIQSLLLAPLELDEQLIGFVGVETVSAARAWSLVETQFMQLFANILAAGEQRSRSIAALRQSNARYDALARQSRTIAWELDLEGRFTYLNDAFEAVLGYPAATALAVHYSEYLDEQESQDYKTRAAELLAQGQPFDDFIAPFRAKSGQVHWLSSEGAPIYADDGQPMGHRGVTRDVTESQLALKRLARSESRLSAIFNNAPIGIALVGHDRRPLMVNRALAKLLGRKAQALIGMRFDDFTHPDDLHTEREAFDQLLSGQRASYRLTKRYLDPDGEVIWCDLRVSLLPPSGGGRPIPLAMIENVTELREALEQRRAAEQELAEYAGQLESMLDLANMSETYAEQARALLELARQAMHADSAVIRLLQDDRQQVLFAVAADDAADDPEPLQLPPALLAAAAEKPGSPIRSAQGGEHEAAAAIGLLLEIATPDGNREQLLLSLHGESELRSLGTPQRQLLRLIAQRIAAKGYQKQLQDNLVQARERETIGHLASGVSHDFNNLLGVIDANLFFIAAGLSDQVDSDPEVGQVLAETRSALGQAKVITSGMLTMSRSGNVPLEPIDLADTVGEVEQILHQILPPSMRLEVEVVDGLRAFSNRAFLQSALLNLALNARDAMTAEGTLSLSVSAVPCESSPPVHIGTQPAGDCVEIGVTDNGSGITPDLLDRIFEPSFSTKAQQRGHGLGLFMVREFVSRTQAGLSVESRPGAGSCFRLLLPTEQSPSPDRTQRPPAKPPAPASPVAADGAPGPRRVLLVEDDRRVRDALSRLLRSEGLEVETAEHGKAALERLATLDAPIDLVLSDIAMPVMDGLELYEDLVAQYPELPVILMTGQQSHWQPPLDGYGEPAVILRKPIELETLQEAIQDKLDRRSAPQPETS